MKILSPKGAKGLVALSLAAFSIVLCIAFMRSPGKDEHAVIQKKKVQSPLKSADIGYFIYTISAEQASEITYTTGSVIHIPAGAFADEHGKPVTGAVELRYREFHDPVDFFVSGIPMSYDSAGVRYEFESAGMLEILAFQDGKPVYVNPDHKITVELRSEQTDDRYNIYRFDSIAGNWQFVYRDKALPLQDAAEDTAEDERSQPSPQVTFADKQLPLFKPELMDGKNYQFSLSVDTSEFPELAAYSDVQFQVADVEKEFDKAFTSISWNDVLLERDNKGSYLMTLVKGAEAYTFGVKPVFDTAAYKAAYATYTAMLARRRRDEALRRKPVDSLHTALCRKADAAVKTASSTTVLQAQNETKEVLVRRTFIISKFGVWNSDCPASLPKGANMLATYVDSTGKKLTLHTVFLAELGRNALYSLYDPAQLHFNPYKRNILWAVTDDNRLAILTEQAFRQQCKASGEATIVMTLSDRKLENTDDVRRLLRF